MENGASPEVVAGRPRSSTSGSAGACSPEAPAVHGRDRVCTHPSCDEPLDRCQSDHIIPWSLGGLTTQANGHDHCLFHNLDKGDRPPPPAA